MSTAGHRIGRDTHWQVSETKHPTLRAQMQVSSTKSPCQALGLLRHDHKHLEKWTHLEPYLSSHDQEAIAWQKAAFRISRKASKYYETTL